MVAQRTARQVTDWLPVVREWHIARSARAMAQDTATALVGGVLAILSVLGVILLGAIGREIPPVLPTIALMAGGWYYATSVPATRRAVRATRRKRVEGGDDAP